MLGSRWRFVRKSSQLAKTRSDNKAFRWVRPLPCGAPAFPFRSRSFCLPLLIGPIDDEVPLILY